MASRFWIGNSGTWDNVTTTHWSTSSGGAGGASVPTSSDDVFINAGSGTGTVTINTNFSVLSLTTGGFNGTIDFSANNNSPTMGSFSGTGTTVRTLNMGSGTWTVTGAGTAWALGTTTNLTFNANTSTIKFTDTSSSSLTFNGGNGLAYNNIWFSRGTGTGSNNLVANNTFNDLKDNGSIAHSLIFQNGSSITVSTFTVSGNPGNLITLNSTTTGTYTLSKSSGIVSSDYLNIQHCVATGGATWYAGANSVNNQAVATAGSGWIFTAPPAVTLLTNIVSYWKLDGNSNDSAGSNNGTDTSIVYSSGNGIIIQGAGFNGSTSKIVMGAPVIPIGSKSVTFWIKTSTTSDQTAICNFRLGTSDNGDYLHLTTGGFFEYAIQYAGGSSTMATGTTNIHDGSWHFCAGTYDGSVIKVYVDGTLQNTSGSFVDSGARTNNLQFGFDPVNGFNKLTGDLDEIGVWNRTLSQSEITQLYNGGVGLQYPFTSNNTSSSFLSFM